MIYLQNTDEAQRMFIPNNGLTAGESARLQIFSTVSKHEILDVTAELAPLGLLYFVVPVTLPTGLKNGEYEYVVSQRKGIISNGLVQIGEYQHAVRESEGGININQGK